MWLNLDGEKPLSGELLDKIPDVKFQGSHLRAEWYAGKINTYHINHQQYVFLNTIYRVVC